MSLHPVDRYARDVLNGKIVAGPLVRLAAERHQRDRREKRWRFDAARADRVIEFFRDFLRLPDTLDAHGDPTPFLLQPWQIFVTGSLFGWVDSDGLRRFRDGYIEAGKGAGKTPWLAGVGLYGLVADGEQSAEIYAAGVDWDQSMILFRDAQHMVAASPALTQRVQVHVGNLAYPPTMSFFRPFSREQGQKSGVRPHMALIDEIHEHPSGEIVNKMRAGVKRRRQPLSLEITNSGFDRTSVCWEHHEHARKVLEQVIDDDRQFAYVCSLDEGDDPLSDETCWPKANPAIGVTVTRDYLRRQVENARHIPGETNTVLRLNFCMWTQANTRFLSAAQWATCQQPVDPADLVGVPCFAGLDLGQSDDFSAFVRVWLLTNGRVAVASRFWIPESALTKYPNRPYLAWRRGGWLEVTSGNTTDYDVIQAAVQADCLAAGVRELAYDKRFAEQMALHLRAAGVNAIDQPQGFQLNAGVRRLGELVAEARLCHDGHPILGWMADNLVVHEGRDKDLRPAKERSSEKIDGMVALIMALGRAMVAAPAPASVYESRGLLTI